MNVCERNSFMSIATEVGQNFQVRVSEGFCWEINKLDVFARLHAIELIVNSLKNQEKPSMLGGDIPYPVCRIAKSFT